MPALEFVGQSVQDSDNKSANTGRLVNCYREATETGYVLKSVLGTELVTGTDQVICTAMATINDVLYAAVGTLVFQISSAGVATAIIAIPFDSNTTITGNNHFVVVTAGGTMFSYNVLTNTVTTVTTGAFTDIGSTAFLGQRTFMAERDGRRFQWSALVAPTTVSGLDFVTAESKDDSIVRIASINGLLWVFGTASIERWYLTGQVNIIAPVSGVVVERGLKQFTSFVATPNGAMFVSTDNRAYRVDGQNITPISTTAVETAITQGEIARCIYYQDEGHEFVCIVFADRPAWCYDITTNEWHERAESLENPFSVYTTAVAYGRTYGADARGNILKFVPSQLDWEQPLIRQAFSRTLNQEGRSFIVPRLELQTEVGRVRDYPFSPDTIISLRTSLDRGQNWTSPKPKSLGVAGASDTRVVWRALGRFPSTMTAHLSWSDPVDTPINATVWVDIA